MPGYRENEKSRHVENARTIFGPEAGRMDGTYNGIARPFCLPDHLSAHNLHESIRQAAIDYFRQRKIPWHDGKTYTDTRSGTTITHGSPSNHVCCSQCQCVNALFAFRNDPVALRNLLTRIGFDVAQCLPVLNDHGESESCVGFEWIGRHNYLMEHSGGRPARCNERSRGANFTSADFVLRFKSKKGQIHLVLGEWKYTEDYRNTKTKALGASGTTRLGIYAPLVRRSGLNLPKSVKLEDLMFEPFYQLMRLQLLASEMERPAPGERTGEMGADIVSVLHVSPSANSGLHDTITSTALEFLGTGTYQVWERIAPPGRFRHVDSEKLFGAAVNNSTPNGFDRWADWMTRRYL